MQVASTVSEGAFTEALLFYFMLFYSPKLQERNVRPLRRGAGATHLVPVLFLPRRTGRIALINLSALTLLSREASEMRRLARLHR